MRAYFRSTEIPKRFVKAVQTIVPDFKHSQAQEVTARLFGYRDWHELAQLTATYTGEPSDVWSMAPRMSDCFISEDAPANTPLPERFRYLAVTLEELVGAQLYGEGSVGALRHIFQLAFGAQPLAGKMAIDNWHLEDYVDEDGEHIELRTTKKALIDAFGMPAYDPREPEGDFENHAWWFRLQDGTPFYILGNLYENEPQDLWTLYANEDDRTKVVDAVTQFVHGEVYDWPGRRLRAWSPEFAAKIKYVFRPEVAAALKKLRARMDGDMTFFVKHNWVPGAKHKFMVTFRDEPDWNRITQAIEDEDALLKLIQDLINSQ